VKYQKGTTRLRDKVITNTDAMGKLASIPIVVNFVNSATHSPTVRAGLDRAFGIHRDAPLPRFHSDTFRRTWRKTKTDHGEPTALTRGRVVIFATCYGNYNEPRMVDDLAAVFEHNGITLRLPERERCCGMPKLELGDLETVERYKKENIAELVRWVDEGWDIVAPVPSCVLMFKQELPLMFPEDHQVQRVRKAIFDPFEYLSLRAKEGKLRTDFKHSLGRVSYHVACHQRVQNIGLKTRDILALVPETKIDVIERCSGHDGTYAVKTEFYTDAMRIGTPVFNRVREQKPDHYTSDCPIAAHHIGHGLDDGTAPDLPLGLLRRAYGI